MKKSEKELVELVKGWIKEWDLVSQKDTRSQLIMLLLSARRGLSPAEIMQFFKAADKTKPAEQWKNELEESLVQAKEILAKKEDSETARVVFKSDLIKDTLLSDTGLSKVRPKIEARLVELFFSKEAPVLRPYLMENILGHLSSLGEQEKLIQLGTSFEFWMERFMSVLEADEEMESAAVTDFELLESDLDGSTEEDLNLWNTFFQTVKEVLQSESRYGSNDWPLYKIYFQMAMDHGDDSPVTAQAEKWLHAGRCDWTWVKTKNRPKSVKRLTEPQLTEIAELEEGSFLGMCNLTGSQCAAWTDSGDLYFIHDNGQNLVLSEGILGAKAVSGGRVLGWTQDNTIKLWSSDGDVQYAYEVSASDIQGVVEAGEGVFMTWSSEKVITVFGPECEEKVFVEETVTGALTLLPLDKDFFVVYSKESEDSESSGAFDFVPDYLSEIVENEEPKNETESDGQFIFTLWSNKTGKYKELGHPKNNSTGIFKIYGLNTGDFLSTAPNGEMRLWNKNGDLVIQPQSHIDEVMGVKSVPGGGFMSWFKDGIINMYNSKGSLLKVLEGHERKVVFVEQGIDASLVSISDDRTVRVWNGTGEQVRQIMDTDRGPVISTWRRGPDIEGLKILSDGAFLRWTGSDDEIETSICLWTVRNDAYTKLKSDEPILSIEELPNSTLMICTQRKILLWDNPRMPNVLVNKDQGTFTYGETHTDETFTFSSKNNSTFSTWNIHGEMVLEYPGLFVLDQEFVKTPEGLVYAWRPHSSITVRDLSGKELHTSNAPSTDMLRRADAITVLSKKRFLTYGFEGGAYLWKIEEETISYQELLDGETIDEESAVVGAFELKDDSLMTYSLDGILRHWAEDGEFLNSFENIPVNKSGWIDSEVQYQCGVSVLSDNRLAYMSKGHLIVWDPYSTIPESPKKAKPGEHDSLRELPNGQILTWGTGELENILLRLYSPDLKTVQELKGHESTVNNVMIKSDWFMSYSYQDFKFFIWSFEGKLLRVLEGPTNESKILMVKDGQTLFYRYHDEPVYILDNMGLEMKKYDYEEAKKSFSEFEDHLNKGVNKTKTHKMIPEEYFFVRFEPNSVDEQSETIVFTCTGSTTPVIMGESGEAVVLVTPYNSEEDAPKKITFLHLMKGKKEIQWGDAITR